MRPVLDTGVTGRRVAVRPPTRAAGLEFAGCKRVRVSESEILGPEWEGRRVEYWHAASETAWLAREPTTPWHESASRLLPKLLRQICQARGSDAHCFGAMDLRIREEDGRLTDIMQADETLYLHPTRAKLPGRRHLTVGEDDFPDVVLEVDHTTDVRRGKLLLYEEWGFPEVWVETPERAAPSRPAGLRPGLTIYLRDDGRYREADQSRAFPGWRAVEIHRALNETVLSDDTAAVLWRVGRALGDREGTGPEDDFLLRKIGREATARGAAEGRAEGRAAMAASILRRRGIEVSARFPTNLTSGERNALERADPEALVDAASRCRSEADFLAALR